MRIPGYGSGLLGVSDETRLGALRFRWVDAEVFQAPSRTGVPALIELGRILQSTEAEYFGLGLPQARAIIKEVATAAATWRDVAQKAGARASEIYRMASAFEHDDLRRALAL
jgi:hypothetical protein